jgi:quercetin dioxygenase-like cupin family protein
MARTVPDAAERWSTESMVKGKEVPMNKTRMMALAVLIVASTCAVARSQQPEVKRSDPATALTAGNTHGTHSRETITVAADEPIPNLPGKRLVIHIVDYPPGGGSVPHRHADSAFVYAYVISGEIRSQVESEPARVYRAGEAWFESPGSRHPVSSNASTTEPARLLAVVIVDAAEKHVTIPDAQ